MAVKKKSTTSAANIPTINEITGMEKDLVKLRQTIANSYAKSLKAVTREVALKKKEVDSLTKKKKVLSNRLKTAKARLMKNPSAIAKQAFSKMEKEFASIDSSLKDQRPALATARESMINLKQAANRFTTIENGIAKTEAMLTKPKKKKKSKPRSAAVVSN